VAALLLVAATVTQFGRDHQRAMGLELSNASLPNTA
jgi:hypothetical protein